MSEQYPLCPKLPEQAAEEAQALVEWFKDRLRKAAEEVLGDVYCSIIPHIETDSWTNYRNAMMEGFKDYGNAKVQAEHDFKAIRATILQEHRDEIINDLNQDHLERIAELEGDIAFLRRNRF